jgi:hypothetical protein
MMALLGIELRLVKVEIKIVSLILGNGDKL